MIHFLEIDDVITLHIGGAYCYHLIANHPFIDGNKRIGVLAMLTFPPSSAAYRQLQHCTQNRSNDFQLPSMMDLGQDEHLA